MNTLYRCEHCGKLFDDAKTCEWHEGEHLSRSDKYSIYSVTGKNNFDFPNIVTIKNENTGDCASYSFPVLRNV